MCPVPLDLSRVSLHPGWMTLLRPLFILCLIVAVLPWGAHGGALAAQLRLQRDLGHSIARTDITQEQVTQGASSRANLPHTAYLTPPPKRCRMAGLVGGACGPDIVLPAVALAPGGDVLYAPLLPVAGIWSVGVTLTGLLDPPRAG
ncbi:MAG: hypothetical protein V4747_14245 [Pseudomonadota bacterium]